MISEPHRRTQPYPAQLPVLCKIAIYAPMIYTAPSIMFWMRAYPLQGQVGGGWALEIESFLGRVKCHLADRRVLFGAQKTQGCINHWCIGGFIYKSPRRRIQGPGGGGWGNRCIKELNRLLGPLSTEPLRRIQELNCPARAASPPLQNLLEIARQCKFFPGCIF